MKAIIYVGPSIPLGDARGILDAHYLPPVQQGDLISAVTTFNPDVIGVIDGEFFQTLSVWHKEFLYALQRGIHVFGASSMGALRAAETAKFGTVGIGRIYRMFASGELTDDDEVALAHGSAEDDYRALSDPLVNIRATLAKAVAQGVIDEPLVARLIALEKAEFFPQRSYHHMFESAREAGEDGPTLERLREFVRSGRVDQKRLDAIELLEHIRDLPRPLAPFVPTFKLEWTGSFMALYEQDRTVVDAASGADVPLVEIQTHVALHAPDFNSLNAQALDRGLMQVLADTLGVEVTADDVLAERKRFCVERKLESDDALAEWQQKNHLSPDEFALLMTQLARRRVLHRWIIRRRSFVGTTRLVLDELRMRGDYPEWVRRTAEHERLLADTSIDDQLDSDAAVDDGRHLSDLQLALEHMRATPCRMPIRYNKWAEDAGILSAGRFRMDLLRARMARRRAERQLDRLADVSAE